MNSECVFDPNARFHFAIASMVLLVAGFFGHEYVAQPGHYLALALYAFCLASSVLLILRTIDPISSEDVDFIEYDREPTRPGDESLNEDAEPTPKTDTFTQTRKLTRRTPVQQSLDFDGTDALKALGQVTGQWLVTEASDPAARMVRTACLAQVMGGDVEIARVERWFDIADSLRSRTCRALPKAELRRSFVADHHGVSKEQVRQIDQGRYVPLNKLLDEIDPKSLKVT